MNFLPIYKVNDSAVQVLGDDMLKDIARELVKSVHENATIDWTMKENVRAKLRVMVRRILRRYGYPPDKQDKSNPRLFWNRLRLLPEIGLVKNNLF